MVYRAISEGSDVIYQPHHKRSFINVLDISKVIMHGIEKLNEVQGILFPVGMMKSKDEILTDMSITNRLIQANMGAVAYFLSKIYPIFIKKNKGVIVGFGSVSSIIGRDVNAIYAASKRGL